MRKTDLRRVEARAPQRRPVRAETVVIRQPAPLLPSISLEDTLAAVGILPRHRRNWLNSRHGLLWRWFAHESTPLAAVNLIASTLVVCVALTMTGPGMTVAARLGAAPFVYAVLNDGLPYLGAGLLAAAFLKALHAALDAKAHWTTKTIGYGLALVLASAGLWTLTMFGYARFVPWLFQPLLAMVGGTVTGEIHRLNAVLVSYFEPTAIGGVGVLLLLKQFKSGAIKRAPMIRKRIALAGFTLGIAIALVAAHAAYRHFTGADAREGLHFAVGEQTALSDDTHYGPLFAAGVPCHVSSLYGWRDDPLAHGRNEKHQGIDVAVREGTPVQAMTDGRVLFAEFDGGLGNFVALQADGPGAPTIVNGHMSRLLVRVGDVVHRGDVIGYAGSTGRSTGPHVHLQLCPSGHRTRGAFVCGGATNPYENWQTLSALARMACVDGPQVY